LRAPLFIIKKGREKPVKKQFLICVLLVFCISIVCISESKSNSRITSAEESPFKELKWREIGPYRGGRSAAVTGVGSQRNVYYFGGTGGGVWKTIDGGNTWQNVSDGFFGGSIGAVAVSEQDPNVIYVGGGEITVRGNVSHGNGVWKSTDAGKSWTHIGLEDSRQIGRIRIHPQDPNLVYVAALGHLFGPNDMRGVYRSRDGGKNWQRILFANRDAGVADLVLDPTNPRIVYATTWRVRRTPYSLESGGEGSGLWKSTDGGDTWINLTRNKGLPEEIVGISGITVSPTNPQNLYAIIEADKGGVFRSRDGGETWEKTNEDRSLRQRAWYYTRIYADPKDEEVVYVLNVQFHKSKDGGKTFFTIPVPHGDNHDLWIDPNDPLRMIEGNDGGACVTLDGGKNWSTLDNQPTAQIYRISTDNDFPFRLLGAQQDNSALRIRYRTGGAGIGPRDWEPTAGGESGYVVADPENPDLVYGGSYGGYLTTQNHRTDESRDVNPWPDNPMGHGAQDYRYRFQWNFPIFFSPHKPHALYAAANVLFRSTNHGASWEIISPDLTRNDPKTLIPSGGPITKDNTGVEYYGTIFYALESPHEPGVLWAGSDDGLIHVSRDAGKNWKNVTPKEMPKWIQINEMDADPFEKGGVYVAATMYKSDDFQPYLYQTTDYGATWKRINNGIPKHHFTRVVRADPKVHGLLYAGTEEGIYVSLNNGESWQSMQGKLPVVPITDIAVREEHLLVATQGRGFWALDDLAPIREFKQRSSDEKFHLYAPAPVDRMISFPSEQPPVNMGTNPPEGVTVQFDLRDTKVGTTVKLEFFDANNKLLRSFEEKVKAKTEKQKAKPSGEPQQEKKAGAEAARAKEERKEEEKGEEKEEKKEEPEIKFEPVTGWNQFSWNLRLERAKKFEGLILWNEDGVQGPRIVPGKYQVKLTVGDRSQTQAFQVTPDPRPGSTQADLQEQFAFLLECRDKLTLTHQQVEKIRSVRTQLNDLKKRLKTSDKYKSAIDAATQLDKKMTAVEEALYQTKNKSRQDPLNFPIRLNDKLASVSSTAATGDFAPTAQSKAVKKELIAAIDAELKKLDAIWKTDLPAFNGMLRQLETPAIQATE
jgi:photosystem II stability/assembly factor-like uncharacterized protein